MGEIPVTQALNNLFTSINCNFWYSYLLAVTGLGVLTMALLQTAKNTTPICRWFQRWQMLQFLKTHAGIAKCRLGTEVSYLTAEEQIILLATDKHRNAFYELEIEKLCGQWNAAVQIVIDSPSLYPAFFECVSARVAPEDFRIVRDRKYPDPLPPHLEGELDPQVQKERLNERQAFIDAKTRVSHQIQRAIDSFQIATAYDWKWSMQIASFLLSFVLAWFAMVLATNVNFNFPRAAIWAAISGFLAPVARDLLAAIQKLRNPS